MGEVLVVQVGNNANFIGSHMWNSRGESDGDYQSSKLYHKGLKKHYPRSIFIEAPNNLGSITSLDSQQQASSSVWSGATQVVGGSMPSDGCADPARHGAKYWTDIIKPELHNKSICELPKWTTGDYFDSFHKGVINNSSNDTVHSDFLEMVMDNCRYFAEGCDQLGTIEIVTEHTGGVAGLSTSLLQSLREEFGNSVCMPVWSANARISDEELLKFNGATLIDTISGMQNRISVLDPALFYNKSLEFASSIVPISLAQILKSIHGNAPILHTEADRIYNTYISTATAAAALNTAACYLSAHTISHNATTGVSALHYGDPHGQSAGHLRTSDPRAQSSRSTAGQEVNEANIDSAHMWCAMATLRGRLPVCFMEASFPGILNNSHASMVGEYPGFEQFMVDSFDVQKYAFKSSAPLCMNTVNPFCVSLSPTPHSRPKEGATEGEQCSGSAGSAGKRLEFPYEKAFTNVLSIKGTSSESLREALYAQGTSAPYRITACQLDSSPLYVSTNSPFYNESGEREEGENQTQFMDQDEDQDEETQQQHQSNMRHRSERSCVEMATSVNTSRTVGVYLHQQAALWQAAVRIPSLAVQLSKAGMDATECTEMAEQLSEMASRYEE